MYRSLKKDEVTFRKLWRTLLLAAVLVSIPILAMAYLISSNIVFVVFVATLLLVAIPPSMLLAIKLIRLGYRDSGPSL